MNFALSSNYINFCTFGTIKHRTRRCKGCLNRDGILYMMFKLGQCAEKKWKKLRGFDYLAKLIEGIQFSDGIEVIPEIRIAACLTTQTPLLAKTLKSLLLYFSLQLF